MLKDIQSPPIPIEYEYDKKNYTATYTINTGFVTVNSQHGSRSTRIKGSYAYMLARRLFREILEEAQSRGDL